MTDDIRNVALVDKRPYFEKALSFGVANRIIDTARCNAIITDGAKGTVQVADHFGSSHLHADLDNARKRIVNLVSLYLEENSGGSLEHAAVSLRDNSFLSHSRGGNEMLKNLHAMPDSTVFGDVKGQALKDFQNERTLSKPYSLTAYRKERQKRQQIAANIKAALWFADDMGTARSSLDFIAAETVIRTAILMRLGDVEECPNRGQFAKLVDTIRTRALAAGKLRIPKAILAEVPEQYREVADTIRREIEKHDAPQLLDAGIGLDVLLNMFESRYFVRESGMEDVDQFDAYVSKEWHKVTKGKEDPYSRLTIFLCLASGVKPKPAISDTEAKSMVRRLREHGFDSDAVSAFVNACAPFEIREDLLSLWEDEFLPDAQERVLDEDDTKYVRAMQFLDENCNIKAKEKK
ncbi:MAG: hypothetical protein V4632_17190 [Pseudomonadota bacterium]